MVKVICKAYMMVQPADMDESTAQESFLPNSI